MGQPLVEVSAMMLDLWMTHGFLPQQIKDLYGELFIKNDGTLWELTERDTNNKSPNSFKMTKVGSEDITEDARMDYRSLCFANYVLATPRAIAKMLASLKEI